MRNGFLSLTLLFMLFGQTALAREVAGVNLSEQIEVGAQPLLLNGAGVRSKFFIDAYVAGLYLPQKSASPAAIYAQSGPKRVKMHILFDLVTREKLISSWNDGFQANLSVSERAALQPRIDAFNALFPDLSEGDTIQLDYLPGKGTEVSVSGRSRGTISGQDFYTALLKVWLGAEPADDDLKEALLGDG